MEERKEKKISAKSQARATTIPSWVPLKPNPIQSSYTHYKAEYFLDLGDVLNGGGDGGEGGGPSIVQLYPIAAGFPNVRSSSGVAILELRKPVSSNRPSDGCVFRWTEKRGAGGRSRDKGETMLSRLLLLVVLVEEDVLRPCQEGVTMLRRNVPAAEGLPCSRKVGVGGETRLISTVSAREIFRSVQRGRTEAMPGFVRLPLLGWWLSKSFVLGVGVPLLVPGDESSSGRRIQSL